MTKNLVVYFSKDGEQYGVGEITEGNTAVLAKIIAAKLKADLFEIKLKNDTYPKGYEPLTKVALSEKKAKARPEIEEMAADFAQYDTVFLGCPNWWADMPMAVYSFIEKYDWSDKRIAPFVTHEGSGMSGIDTKIAAAANPKEVLNGLEMYGHIAQNQREEATQRVDVWLKKSGF
ncbi:MAG: flavodoxin [Alphaproteobacteria bacterium]|nr:flavodoxin [Alphaproteobacteria bacterium]